jgi:FkbM family methyltransferase
MQTVQFQFDGHTHQMFVPEGHMARGCALEIIEEKAYPLQPANPKVIVDLGAHAGEFTMLAALMWPQAQIHAYEPYLPPIECLRRNTARFPNVTVHPCAVGLRGGMQSLFISGHGSVCNSLDNSVIEVKTGIEIPVPVLDCRQVPKCDMLKIDIEGGEPEILRAMNAPAIQRVYVEFHSEADRKSIQALFEPTHSLVFARVEKPDRGEMLWEREPVSAGR